MAREGTSADLGTHWQCYSLEMTSPYSRFEDAKSYLVRIQQYKSLTFQVSGNMVVNLNLYSNLN